METRNHSWIRDAGEDLCRTDDKTEQTLEAFFFS